MNLIVNSRNEYKIENIEGEILSTNGRVKLLGIEIPPYPKLLHLSDLNKKMVAQKKVNGYNVRLTYVPMLENFIAVLRGGYVCAKTTFMLRKKFYEVFMNFFKENPRKILCIEVLGKKSLANLHIDYYKEHYSIEDIGYFIFDIMDMDKQEDERFYPFEQVEKICKQYNFQLIPIIGIFENIDDLNRSLKEIPEVFEGAVVKSLDGREIIKYRFDDRPELFAEKLPEKKEKQIPPENIIVSHFFQGYEEVELGLDSGITQEEMDKYNKMLDSMQEAVKKDRSKVSEESKKITDFLMTCINEHGTFEEDMLKKIEKLIKKKIGSEVSKMLRT